MIRHIKAPVKVDWERLNENGGKAIFAAGTIDNGTAAPWCEDVFDYFLKKGKDVTILNPRRVSWDPSWEQSKDNPQFNEQVNWELDGLDYCDYIIMNILPGSASPITLLELGMFVRSGKLLVCCPDGFYRKGNVDIVCERHNVPVFDTLEELLDAVSEMC